MPRDFQELVMGALSLYAEAHESNRSVRDAELTQLRSEEDVHVYAKEHIAEELDIDMDAV